MKRIRRRHAQENTVEMVINILENKISPQFSARKKQLLRHGIHKQVKNKYHKIFIRIVDYLDDLRLEHKCKNSLEDLAEDYLMSVYEYYWQFKRMPNLTQLSPATNNQIRFGEWIDNYIRDNEEGYWVYESPKSYKIVEVPIEVLKLPSFAETK